MFGVGVGGSNSIGDLINIMMILILRKRRHCMRDVTFDCVVCHDIVCIWYDSLRKLRRGVERDVCVMFIIIAIVIVMFVDNNISNVIVSFGDLFRKEKHSMSSMCTSSLLMYTCFYAYMYNYINININSYMFVVYIYVCLFMSPALYCYRFVYYVCLDFQDLHLVDEEHTWHEVGLLEYH